MIIEYPEQLDGIDFAKGDGLIPLVVQHVDTGNLRMLGYADRDALERTLTTGFVHFFSRSRGALWKKGETSGNTLSLISLHIDCDGDAALALVTAAGPTCHTGAETCFAARPFLDRLTAVVDQRAGALAAGHAGNSYTARLLADRNLRLKKLTEEAGELAVACADEDRHEVASEAADLLYHMIVACRAVEVRFEDVVKTLRERHE